MKPTVMMKLGDIMVSKGGSVDPSKHADEVFHLYSIPAFDRGKPDVAVGASIGSSKQVVQPGDVLLSRIVPHIRRAWIVAANGGKRAIASGEWIVFRGVNVHPAYMRHILTSDEFHGEFMRTVAGVGGSLLRARPSQVANIAVPLPKLPEQRRIAAILDAAEALREKRRQTIEIVRELNTAYFRDVFGDPTLNAKRWPVARLGELAINEDGRRVPVKTPDRMNRTGAYPYYGASGIIDYVDEYIFEGDRLLIGEDGANLLARSSPVAFIASGRFWVNNHAHVLASNGWAELRFLEFVIELTHLKPYISGTAQPKLTHTNLDRIPVISPPLELQHHFCEWLDKSKDLLVRQKRSDEFVGALLSTLQERGFRGEL